MSMIGVRNVNWSNQSASAGTMNGGRKTMTATVRSVLLRRQRQYENRLRRLKQRVEVVSAELNAWRNALELLDANNKQPLNPS